MIERSLSGQAFLQRGSWQLLPVTESERLLEREGGGGARETAVLGNAGSWEGVLTWSGAYRHCDWDGSQCREIRCGDAQRIAVVYPF